MGDFGWTALGMGAAAALLVGFSKTGMPGAAIPAVALMADAFPEQTRLSVGALLPILLLGDLFALSYYRRHADWGRLIELVPYVLAGMLPGYWVLATVPDDNLRRLLGALILALLVVQLARHGYGWQPLPNRRWLIGTTGLLAGFGTTVGNAAGPIMSIYLVGQRLEKREFLGTAAWFFFLVNLSKIPGFVLLGMITRRTLAFDLMVLPVVVIGAVIGVLVLKRLPQHVFNRLVLSLAGVAAVRLLFF